MIVGGVCFAYRLYKMRRDRDSEPSTSAGPAQSGGIAMQQVAVVMQHNAGVVIASATPIQQPAMTSVMATCPPGMKPGDAMTVAGPGGQMMSVQVPPGVVAGGQFVVNMPAAPVVIAQATPVCKASGHVADL